MPFRLSRDARQSAQPAARRPRRLVSRRGAMAMAAAGVLMFQASPEVRAQGADVFPSKPIRIVVGYPPGGSSDNIARVVAERMSIEMNAPVVIVNRPGAGSTLAAGMVAAAPADGYTLLLLSPGTNAVSAAMYPNLPYDPVKSFAPISQLAFGPVFVLVGSASPLKSMSDLVAVAQAAPGKLTFSHSGTGTGPHLVGEAIALAMSTKFVHVPYAGAAPATLAVLGSQVDFSISDISAVPHLQSGALRALAVSTPQRWRQYPNVPTLRQSGVNFDYTLSVGLVATTGTPAEIVQKLHAAVSKAVASPEAQQRFATLGFEASATSPEAFGAMVAGDVAKFGPIVRQTGLKQ
jgi:tripartite-type tricarboxylate transporter receptor subunit TctC